MVTLVAFLVAYCATLFADQRPNSLAAWELDIQRDVTAKEYHITWQDDMELDDVRGAWHAPNRAQGFRTYFVPERTLVVARTSSPPEWSWEISLVGYGRGELIQPVDRAALHPDENRIRSGHGQVDEWFVNEPRGLKHGFVIHEPPGCDRDAGDSGGAIHLDLRIGGTLTPRVAEGGKAIHFVAPSGAGKLYYRGLDARDATGRSLPAWMEIYHSSRSWTVRLLTDDNDAVYPIEVDPLATTAAWTGEIDLEGAWLGIYVDGAGDVNGDGYDDLIMGASHYDNGENNEGAAFVFLGSNMGPSMAPDWMTEGNEAVALAGRSVGGAGDVNGDGYDDVIVGVPGLGAGGGAWVFHGSETGLSEIPDWIVQSDQSAASFGSKVGAAGDVNGDGYDDVIVGAKLYDQGSPPGIFQDGRAFVYQGSSSGLSTVPNWVTAGGQSNAAYGQSVNTAGDVNGDGYDDVIVGAYQYDNGEVDEGRAYVYHGSSTGLSLEPDWIYENNDIRACLGGNVNTAGDVNNDGYDDVVIGAAYLQCWNFPESTVGKAYVFHGSASGLTTNPVSVAELRGGSTMFGGSVGTPGDANNDDFDDVVVGALYFDNDETDEGAVFLFLGSEVGMSTEHAWMVEGNQAGSRYGCSVAAAGDVNGEGVVGVVVGAFRYDLGQIDEGAAFLYQATSAPAGRVPTETPLRLAKRPNSSLELTWGPSCLPSDSDYEAYEGEFGDYRSHTAVACSTGGQTTITILPSDRSVYYLIVPRNADSEGSYGTTSDGLERPPGLLACLPRVIGSCE